MDQVVLNYIMEIERERKRENNIKREHFFHEVANYETHTRDLGCEL